MVHRVKDEGEESSSVDQCSFSRSSRDEETVEKVNQFQLDVDMVDMDGETSTNQISTKSSEKVTAQHHRKEVEGKKASLEVQMVATKKESEEKTREITKLTSELRAAEQDIEKLKAQQQPWGAPDRESADELTSDRDLANTELPVAMESDVVKYLAKFNDMRVANTNAVRRRRGVQLRPAVSESSRRLCPFCLRAHCCKGPDHPTS